jgi:hypothetical protein
MTRRKLRELFREVQIIMKRKPNDNTWNIHEYEKVYRWFYSEMEIPREDQLHYILKRFRESGKECGVWWFAKLLSLYPTVENWKLFVEYSHTEYREYHKLIWKMLKEKELSTPAIRLVVEQLSIVKRKGTYRLACKMLANAEYRSWYYQI